MGKRITFDLSQEGIDKALREVEVYKKEFSKKWETFCQRVAERMRDRAQQGFIGAIVDDVLPQSGGPRLANVSVDLQMGDDVMLIIAQGEDAVWVEFGSGVYHNGMVGSSPNPYGSKIGFTIGSYGTKGKQPAWGFYEDGELKLTRGTPAQMPLYRAVESVLSDLDTIAREVFG